MHATHDQIGTHTCTKSTGRNMGLDVTINRSIKWLLIECVKTFNKVALTIFRNLHNCTSWYISYLSVEVWIVWVWVEGWRWGGPLMLNYHLENLLKIRLSKKPLCLLLATWANSPITAVISGRYCWFLVTNRAAVLKLLPATVLA